MSRLLVDVLARELRARESLREWMKRHRPFESDSQVYASPREMLVPVGHMLPKQILFGLQLGVDTRLVPLIGIPGKGKTHLARIMSLLMMYQGEKVKSITRKVHEFRDLLVMRSDFYDLEPGDIRLNPFVPPLKSISQKKWNEIIASTFQSDAWLRYYSGTNLAKILDDFTAQYPRSLITSSKLIEFMDRGRRNKFRKLDLDEKVRSRLESLVSGEAKQMFDTHEQIAFEFYAQNNINFNLSSLNTNQLVFFIAVFISMLVNYKRETQSMTRDCLILDDYGDLVAEVKLQ